MFVKFYELFSGLPITSC